MAEERTSAPEVALFVFIPFCKIKCTYCDFNAYANMARVMEPYAEAVAHEIEMSARVGATSASPLPASPLPRAKTLYFGGGTPSLVPAAHIETIMRVARAAFSFVADPEITLEANPGTVNLAKLRALRALGINRLSLGVQSFDDATVRRLNRGHTVSDAVETYEWARRAGYDNINLDFIYGLPLQTIDDWRTTLARALALAPEHLSLYALKVEEGTGLEHQIRRGKYPRPDDDLAADMYELAEEMLDGAGYEHYEISNWARRDVAAVSRHNLTYWYDEPYFGFGAGAHSYFGGARYWNVLSPLEYIQRIRQGEGVIAGREEIGRELEMAETLILGLRLGEGVAFERFRARFGEDARDKYERQLRETQALGLVEMSEERVRLTPRGRLLSNEVFWRLLPG